MVLTYIEWLASFETYFTAELDDILNILFSSVA